MDSESEIACLNSACAPTTWQKKYNYKAKQITSKLTLPFSPFNSAITLLIHYKNFFLDK